MSFSSFVDMIRKTVKSKKDKGDKEKIGAWEITQELSSNSRVVQVKDECMKWII